MPFSFIISTITKIRISYINKEMLILRQQFYGWFDNAIFLSYLISHQPIGTREEKYKRETIVFLSFLGCPLRIRLSNQPDLKPLIN